MKIISIVIILLSCLGYAKQQDVPGKEIYEKNCVRCHGSVGTKHFLGAKDLQKSKMDDGSLSLIIQDGKWFMPAYKKKLNAQQINSLISYLKVLRK